MIRLPTEVVAEVSSVKWLSPEKLKSTYADLLKDAMNCPRVEILRSIVAYRLQERYYNISVPASVMRTLERAVEGDKLLHAPADEIGRNVKRLVRNWKGKDYEVLVLGDNRVEYEGKTYKSLTAVAKAITGTHWNGPVFFGVKK